MAVTNQEVRAVLDRDEPDYERAAELGPEAVPLLQRFVEGGDPRLAPKAAYLAGRIGGPAAASVLELAAQSADPSLRAAAAHGARHLKADEAEAVLTALLDDDDAAVRKTAVNAVAEVPSPALLAKVEVLRGAETDEIVRGIAADVVERASGGN